MRAIFRNPHTLSVASQGITSALGFASFLVLVRTLTSEAFGVWVLYLTATTMLDTLRSGFVQSGLVRHLSTGDSNTREAYTGAGLALAVATTVPLVGAVVVVGQFVDWDGINVGWTLFFGYWPILGLSTLPFQFAMWIQQARSRFDRVLILRVVVNGCFLLGVGGLALMGRASIELVAMIQISAAVIGSVVATLAGWAPLRSIRNARYGAICKLRSFGAYSIGTLAGSRTLKSSDAFLIGAMLGPTFVGLFSVAQRIVEAIEIPLRGLSSSLYPEYSRVALTDSPERVVALLAKSSIMVTIAMLPFALILFVWTDFVLELVVGDDYYEASGVLRIFAIAVLLLPLDRFTGIALDSLGRPGLNAAKVLLMVAVNVSGDIVAILVFGTIESVAVVTIVTMAVGTSAGLFLVKSVVNEGTSVPAFNLER